MQLDDKIRRYKDKMKSLEQKYEKDMSIEKQKNREIGEIAKKELHELEKRKVQDDANDKVFLDAFKQARQRTFKMEEKVLEKQFQLYNLKSEMIDEIEGSMPIIARRHKKHEQGQPLDQRIENYRKKILTGKKKDDNKNLNEVNPILEESRKNESKLIQLQGSQQQQDQESLVYSNLVNQSQLRSQAQPLRQSFGDTQQDVPQKQSVNKNQFNNQQNKPQQMKQQKAQSPFNYGTQFNIEDEEY